MATTTEKDRRRAVTQALASVRIEGFEHDAEYLSLLERYVAGELSLAEVRAKTGGAFGPRAQAAV
ncbi:hypothetical protein [Piscinibacter sp. XHJ-5]|uniref:antitoxin VbhA family protein n=1 Tax=Piscinibacter sp. XHJ-5 TaxID=3037797 RepID=UPI0024531665|nr:hypothetical protein [Piscinibacter sp. XHJ-5]